MTEAMSYSFNRQAPLDKQIEQLDLQVRKLYYAHQTISKGFFTITHGSEESNTSTKELGPGNKSSDSDATTLWPYAVTMGQLTVILQNAPGASGSWTATLVKNEVDTDITFTITNPDKYGYEFTKRVAFAAGDTWYVRLAETGTALGTGDTVFYINAWRT